MSALDERLAECDALHAAAAAQLAEARARMVAALAGLNELAYECCEVALVARREMEMTR